MVVTEDCVGQEMFQYTISSLVYRVRVLCAMEEFRKFGRRGEVIKLKY